MKKVKQTKKVPSTASRSASKKRKSDKVGDELISVEIKTHKDRNGGHPHVIVDEVDRKHVSVGMTTHAKKGKNSPNYKLDVNPLGGPEQSYLRRQGTVAPKSEYENPRAGTMTSRNYAQAKTYGAHAKKKYIDNKHKKKVVALNTFKA